MLSTWFPQTCPSHAIYLPTSAAAIPTVSGPLIAPWIPKNGIPDVCLTLGSMFLGTWRYSGTTNLVLLWKGLLE